MGNSIANKGVEPVTHYDNEKVTEVTKQLTPLKGNISLNPVTQNVTRVTHSS